MIDWIRNLFRRPNQYDFSGQMLTFVRGRLPVDMLAIVRINIKDSRVTEFVIMENGEDGFNELADVILDAMIQGADVNIRTEWPLEAFGVRGM
jgi:hypothetical protein